MEIKDMNKFLPGKTDKKIRIIKTIIQEADLATAAFQDRLFCKVSLGREADFESSFRFVSFVFSYAGCREFRHGLFFICWKKERDLA